MQYGFDYCFYLALDDRWKDIVARDVYADRERQIKLVAKHLVLIDEMSIAMLITQDTCERLKAKVMEYMRQHFTDIEQSQILIMRAENLTKW